MLSRSEKLARLKLFRTEAIGSSRFWELVQIYGSAETALTKLPKIFNDSKKNICSDEKIDEEISHMKSWGARFVFWEDELYPPLLRNTPDPPPVLAFLGNRERVLSFYKKNMISVVGARNASIHSNKFCETLCRDLGANDVVIVSGLARGIDTSAHRGSLETGTIAIVANGINIIYPQENKKLYTEIIKENGIFSETPFNVAPQPQLFPRRNRIIAGMSYGTTVIEAAEESGSLITARMALEYNRDVFAVPGSPLDPRSIGCNKLLKEGAILIQNAQDILDQLETKKVIPHQLFDDSAPVSVKASAKDIEKIRKKILDSLSSIPITIDELISSIKVSPQEVLMALLELELANKIVRLHGQRVCLALDS
ncbi:MAG: DNA-processing protein DprA [Holosporaceae bacterium]|jgi:DNA processing protein|nr:DNA-processing protein DprA [Holosporaceae bacterium]